MREMNTTEFRAKCLAVLNEVATTGDTVTVLKRGKPVARVVPAVAEAAEYPQWTLRGRGRSVGDIISSPLASEEWDAERGVLLSREPKP